MSMKYSTRGRVLLVGDSIRQSYQPAVADAFDVVGIPLDVNCRDTRTTLDLVESLDPEQKPACIHWNNGLHDVKQPLDSGPHLVPLDEYERNIHRLLDTFQNICVGSVIWCRTTPVIESRHNNGRGYSRFNQDITRYNAVADAIMRKAGVFIHDLHGVLKDQLEENICEDGVHLTPSGVRLAAESVVQHILHCDPASQGNPVITTGT